MKKTILFHVILFIMLGIMLWMQIKILNMKSIQNPWGSKDQREFANKLKAEGLLREAIEAYGKYIQMEPVGRDIQANVYYTMGKLSEELKEYETALAYYYKVQITDPGSSLLPDVGERIIICLENSGRGLDAQNALDSLTSIDKKESGGKILAKIGKEEITQAHINKELESLPSWMQKDFSEPGKKMDLLKQYIAKELIARKARRLGYDKDPEIRKQVEEIKKQILVGKVLEKEMKEKVKITPNQVELYYKANKDSFVQPAKAIIAHILVENEEIAKDVLKKIKEGSDFGEMAKEYSADEKTKDKNGVIPTSIEEGQKFISGIGAEEEFIKTVFITEKGSVSEPVKTEKGFHLIKVLEREAEKQLTFEEVKDRAEAEYKTKQQEVVYKELIDEVLQSEKVEIYEDNLK